LFDAFDDGAVSTNSAGVGIGNGFVVNDANAQPADPSSSAAVEGNDLATLTTQAGSAALIGLEPIAPEGLTLAWSIDARAITGSQSAVVGWTVPGSAGCCDAPGAYLVLGSDRLTFELRQAGQVARYVDIPFGSTGSDAIYTDTGSPVAARMFMNATYWHIDVVGDGVDVHRAGQFAGVGLTSVLASTGGTLRAFGAAVGTGASIAFDRVFAGAAVPDLSVALGRFAPFHFNSDGSYIVTVTNEGLASTTGATVVTATLPSGIVLLAAGGNGWTCAATTTLTCTFAGPLAAGAATSFPIGIRPSQPGSLVATVAVSTANDGGLGTKSASDHAVVPAPVPLVELTSSSSESTILAPPTLTVHVSSAVGMATGTIQIYDGSTPVSGPLTLSAGIATHTLVASAGEHALTAVYSGDGVFQTTVSAVLAHRVGLAQAPVTVTGVNAGVIGTPVNISARIVTPGHQSPTGTIQFYDGASALGTSVAVSPLAEGGAVASVPLSLSAGPHALTAQYSGDANFAARTSVVFPFTVNSLPVPVQITAPATLSPRITSLAALAEPQALAGVSLSGPLASDLVTVNLSANTNVIVPSFPGFWTMPAPGQEAATITVTGTMADVNRAFAEGAFRYKLPPAGTAFQISITARTSRGSVSTTSIAGTMIVAPPQPELTVQTATLDGTMKVALFGTYFGVNLDDLTVRAGTGAILKITAPAYRSWKATVVAGAGWDGESIELRAGSLSIMVPVTLKSPTTFPPRVTLAVPPTVALGSFLHPLASVLLTGSATGVAGLPATYEWTASGGLFDGLATDGHSVRVPISRLRPGTYSVSFKVTNLNGAGNATASMVVTHPGHIVQIGSPTPPSAMLGSGNTTIVVPVAVTNDAVLSDDATVIWTAHGVDTVLSTLRQGSALSATIPSALLAGATNDISSVLLSVYNNGFRTPPIAFPLVPARTAAAASVPVSNGYGAVVLTPDTGNTSITAAVSGSAADGATLTAATYQSNPTTTAVSSTVGSFMDLQLIGASSDATLIGGFTTTAPVTDTPRLLYHDQASNTFAPVSGSGGEAPVVTVDAATGVTSVAVIFDGTSTPSVTELTGTVFVMSNSAPPRIETPDSIVAAADDGNGAIVRYRARATAANGKPVTAACAPASGSVFPVGATTVTCLAIDSTQLTSEATFTVTVNDTKAPRLDLPGKQVVEATGPAGAIVAFTVSAIDAIDPSPAVACAPMSGTTFPLGSTAVTCTATDDAGNSRSDAFLVVVRDKTDPEIAGVTPSQSTLPANGLIVPVTLTVDVTDLVDHAPTCLVTKVTSNIKDLDKDGERDWSITGPLSVSVEAATKKRKDRRYVITVKCTDASGNASREKTTVIVSRMP
jgi:hypothetical protein